jgi:hypothetical protein
MMSAKARIDFAQIPCSGRKRGTDSLHARKIPCSTAQGILSHTIVFAGVSETNFAKSG